MAEGGRTRISGLHVKKSTEIQTKKLVSENANNFFSERKKDLKLKTLFMKNCKMFD